MRTRRISNFVLLLIPLVIVSSRAQWSPDPTVNTPVCVAAGGQGIPSICSDGAGGAFIAWEDLRSGNYDIYVQRLNASGVAQWTANGVVICTAANDQLIPQIVSDGAGGAIITWNDDRSGVGAGDVYAQRINASGGVYWTSNGVAICVATGSQPAPMITSDGRKGAIITWPDERNGNGNSDIYAQRVDSSGNVKWGANGKVICNATNDQFNPVIMSDSYNGAIIAWPDMRNGADNDIYTQRVDSSGTIKWTANGVALCTATNYQWYPVLATDGAGGAIVAWEDSRSGAYDIYAQRISSAGAVQWPANGVSVCLSTDTQSGTLIVSDGAGGAIIAWMDRRNGTDNNYYAQRVDGTGASLWTNNGVGICTATGNQQYGEAITDGSGGAIIAWEDKRNGSSSDIYAQRVDGSGTVQWAANGVAISTAANTQERVALAPGTGGTIITWEDNRAGLTQWDVYAQHVATSGALPVQLTSFSGRLTAQTGVLLEWTTASEVNNYGFYVQRRAGETQDFTDLSNSFVPGHGTTLQPHTYSYTDASVTSGNWAYRLKQIDLDGTVHYTDPVSVDVLTDVKDGARPRTFALEQNYPNPFNPNSDIRYLISDIRNVRLAVYDLLGREVVVLVHERQAPGSYSVTFNASGLASGIYFYRLTAGTFSETKRLTLLK